MKAFRGFVVALALCLGGSALAQEAKPYRGWQLQEANRSQLSSGVPTHVVWEATAQPYHYFLAADGGEVMRVRSGQRGRLSRADKGWKRMAARDIEALYPLGDGVVAMSRLRHRTTLIHQAASGRVSEMASGVTGVASNGMYISYATIFPGIGRLETWAHDGAEARLVQRVNQDEFMVLKDMRVAWSVLGSEESFVGILGSDQGSVSMAIDNKTGERTETYDSQRAVLPMLHDKERDRTMLRFPPKDDLKARARVMPVGWAPETRTIGVINLGIRDWDWKVKLTTEVASPAKARVFDGGIVFLRGDGTVAIVTPQDAEAAPPKGLRPRHIKLHKDALIDFDANPNHSQIVTCGKDRMIQVWDVVPAKEPVEPGKAADPLPNPDRR